MTENKYRMKLRSSVIYIQKEEKPNINRNDWPYIKFNGKIKYYTTFTDCAIICDKLLNVVNNSSEICVIGFDIEWPFSFQTGSGKTSLIQISPANDICYVLHVSKFKKLPKSLSEFLAHTSVRITGVNIKNDIRKLCRDFSGLDAERIIENCIDSSVLANKLLPIKQRWSMEKLINYLLKMRINKDKRIRMSKWHIIPLMEKQLAYAATDAYASLVLYEKLKSIEATIENSSASMN